MFLKAGKEQIVYRDPGPSRPGDFADVDNTYVAVVGESGMFFKDFGIEIDCKKHLYKNSILTARWGVKSEPLRIFGHDLEYYNQEMDEGMDGWDTDILFSDPLEELIFKSSFNSARIGLRLFAGDEEVREHFLKISLGHQYEIYKAEADYFKENMPEFYGQAIGTVDKILRIINMQLGRVTRTEN